MNINLKSVVSASNMPKWYLSVATFAFAFTEFYKYCIHTKFGRYLKKTKCLLTIADADNY